MNDTLKKRLQDIVGNENIFDSVEDRICYSYDAALWERLPAVVVRPTAPEQIQNIMRFAQENKIPVIPRGAGTGLSGGSVPVDEAIVLQTTALNKILEINEDERYAIVESGTITNHLNIAVESRGLIYPPDPSSMKTCTMGGNVAENAGGLRGMKYGVTRDYIEEIDVITPDGERHTFSKHTGGLYNMLDLMVASEGTLGVITSMKCRLVPQPKAKRSLVAVFPQVEFAGDAVSNIIAAGIIPCTLEIVDNITLCAVDDFKKLGLPRDAGALLLVEVDGQETQVVEEAARVVEICRKSRADRIEDKDEKVKQQIWEGRRSALAALARVRPTTILEDATVPRSNLTKMISAVRGIAEKYNLQIGIFGHAGDGNLHPTIVTDMRNKEEMQRVDRAIDEIFYAALDLDGTISGEHGIGVAKAKYLKKQIGSIGMVIHERIKTALDPAKVLNPGKIIRDTITESFEGMPAVKETHSYQYLDGAHEQIFNCMKCGNCQEVCPVYNDLQKETLTARGKIRLARALVEGDIEQTRNYQDAMMNCLTCDACTVVCPCGVEIDDIVKKSRQQLLKSNLSLPDTLQFLRNSIIERNNPFMEKPEERGAWLGKNYQPKEKAEYLYFVGCSVSYSQNRIARSIQRILDATGLDYTILGNDEKCCGDMLFRMGDIDGGKKLAEENKQRFQKMGVKTVFTSCPGCLKNLKKYIGDDIKFIHVSQLFKELLESGILKFGKDLPKKVIYFDGCDLGRQNKVFDEPRAVLAQIPGIQVLEYKNTRENSRCCGGPLMAYNADLARKIAAERVREAVDAGAEMIVTNCPACQINLRDGAKSAEINIEVQDLPMLLPKVVAK